MAVEGGAVLLVSSSGQRYFVFTAVVQVRPDADSAGKVGLSVSNLAKLETLTKKQNLGGNEMLGRDFLWQERA